MSARKAWRTYLPPRIWNTRAATSQADAYRYVQRMAAEFEAGMTTASEVVVQVREGGPGKPWQTFERVSLRELVTARSTDTTQGDQ